MTRLVVDASALVEYLLRSPRSVPLNAIIQARDADLHVPTLCDVEVASAIARLLDRGVLSSERAGEALTDYLDLPVTRHGHQALLVRAIGLRSNFRVDEGTYVALAERLGAAIVTADARLARAALQHTALTVLPG